MAIGQMLREFTVGVSVALDKSGMSKANSAVSGLASDLKAFSFTVSGAAASLFGLASISSTHSRSLQLEAQQLGLTTDKLQELGYAAKVTADVSQDELSGSLQALSHTLFEARNNSSDAARTMQRLGVSLDTIKSGNAADVLTQLSSTFSKMPDGIYKTALAQEALGASGIKMIPFLNQGPEGLRKLGIEVHRSGLVLSKSFINQGAAFDRQLSKIWLVLKNITYVIGGGLIKYLAPLVDQFQSLITKNQKLISLGLGVFFRGLGEVIKLVGNGLTTLGDILGVVVPYFGRIASSGKIAAIAFAAFLVSVAPLSTALATIVVVTRDLYNFFHGKKSFFGAFIKEAQELYIFQKIAGWIKDAYDYISPFVGKLDQILRISDGLKALLDLGKSGLQTTFEGAKNAINWAINGPEISHASAGVQSSGATAPVVNAQVHVSVPRGTTAEQGAAMVSDGVEAGMTRALRATRNQHLGGKAY